MQGKPRREERKYIVEATRKQYVVLIFIDELVS
jgi:hypothetical protein